MEFSDLHPSPPGPLTAGAVSEPLEWSGRWHCHLELPFHTGHAEEEEKKGGFQYDKRPARPSQTPSSRFLNQNQKLFISQMYRWMGLRPAFTLWMLCVSMYSGA